MASSASGEFKKLVAFVDQLIAIHAKVQQGKGRRHRQEAIHRAGVVMTVAAWESYIEKVVIECLGAIEAAANVTASGATGQPVPAWAKHAFALHRAGIGREIKRFHTPNAINVRNILLGSLEFNPWSHWHWHCGPRQWDSKETRDRLDAWVLIRHSVAHGFPLPQDVPWLQDARGRPRLTLTLLKECKRFFGHVVDQTDRGLASHLQVHHGIPKPW